MFDPRPLCCSSLTTAVGGTTDTNFVDSAHPTVARISQTEMGATLFLAAGRAMIDIQKGELKLRVQDDEVRFSVFNAVRHLVESDACFLIEEVEAIVPS